MSTSRVAMGKVAPELYKAMGALDQKAKKFAADSGLTEGLCSLIEVRAAQLNGCAFCLRMHSRAAREAGVSEDKLAVLAGWRESGYYDDVERAALALAEAVTQVYDGQVPDDVYEASAAQLSDEQIAAVEWLTVVINSWNRIAVASRFEVNP